MTDRRPPPSRRGYRLVGGELTVTDTFDRAIAAGSPTGVSVTAKILGADGLEITLANWSATEPTDLEAVGAAGGRTTQRMRTASVMLNTSSIPGFRRVWRCARRRCTLFYRTQ